MSIKTSKVVLTVVVEALSVDCFSGLLGEVQRQVDQDNFCGNLVADDGDTISWTLQDIPVEF